MDADERRHGDREIGTLTWVRGVVAALPNPGSPWRWLPSVTTIGQLPTAGQAPGTARIQHHVGNRREPTGNNGQTISRQTPPLSPPNQTRINAMTSGYYRTSSPVTALPMIMRWISDVPSKIVKILASRCQRSTGYSRV